MRHLNAIALAAVVLGLSVTQAGCSLTGLSDFTITPCTDHAFCEPLNAARGIAADACVRYQCTARQVCALQPLDLDQDGHGAVACAGSDGCGGDFLCDDCDDSEPSAFPGQEEICDGVDNDCNLIVDDLAAGGAVAGFDNLVTGASGVDFHSYGAALPGSAVLPISFGSTSSGFFNAAGRDALAAAPFSAATANVDGTNLASPTISQGCADDTVSIPVYPVGVGGTAGTCTTHEDCDDGVLCNGYELCDSDNATADMTTGCHSNPPMDTCPFGASCNETAGICEYETLVVQSSCSFNSVATAEYAEGEHFGVAVQQTGCGGLVRLGYFTENTSDMMSDPGRSLFMRGSFHRSTSYRGVDLLTEAGSGDCSGRSRPTGDMLGATGPAIAALAPSAARRRPQALAGWVAPGTNTVEIIGAWQEQFSAGGSVIFWVNATGDGSPERLPTASGTEQAPVILSYVGPSRSGYLVAYPAAGSGIAVRFVQAFPDPTEVIPESPFTTPIGPGATDTRTTPGLTAVLGAETVLATGSAATELALTVGRQTGDTAELGFAWQGSAAVHFSTVQFDANAGTFTGFAEQTATTDVVTEVSIGYTPDSVVLEGFERGGATAAADQLGGFLVAWANSGVAQGIRVAELDGLPIDAAPMRLSTSARRIRAYTGMSSDGSRSVPRFAYYDGSSLFQSLSAFCGPPG